MHELNGHSLSDSEDTTFCKPMVKVRKWRSQKSGNSPSSPSHVSEEQIKENCCSCTRKNTAKTSSKEDESRNFSRFCGLVASSAQNWIHHEKKRKVCPLLPVHKENASHLCSFFYSRETVTKDATVNSLLTSQWCTINAKNQTSTSNPPTSPLIQRRQQYCGDSFESRHNRGS